MSCNEALTRPQHKNDCAGEGHQKFTTFLGQEQISKYIIYEMSD
jgi:hypothetical protein